MAETHTEPDAGRAARLAQRQDILALSEGLPPEQLRHLHSALGNLLDCEGIAEYPATFIRANTPPAHPDASAHDRFQAQRVLESEHQMLGMAQRQAARSFDILTDAAVSAAVLAALALLMEQTFLVTQATLEQLAVECGLVMPGAEGQ